MTAVNAILALGAQLYDSPDGVTWTELIDMQDIGSPDEPTINFIAVNPVNPTGRAQQFLPGLIAYGEFEYKQFYSAARYTHTRGFLSTAMTLMTYWKVSLPDKISVAGSTLIFGGYLMSCKLSELETEKPITIDAKAKITGSSTFTPAS